MSDYNAPVRDMLFVMQELAGLEQVAALPGCGDVSADLAAQVLEESARFSAGVLAPLNRSGDLEGSRWQEGGAVRTPGGFKAAY